MKIRPIFLIVILVVFIAMCVNMASAAKLKAFKPPRTEEQMLDWLKECNYEVKKLDESLYAISWEQELPDGQIEAVYGSGICEVLIESVKGKNTARFTYSLRLNINVDVIVSSEVKWVDLPHQASTAKYRYHYHVENLPTSEKPVNTFQVYYRPSLITSQQNGYVGQHLVPTVKDISNPSGLWGGWEQESSQSGLWEYSREILSRPNFKPVGEILSRPNLKRIIWGTGEMGIIAARSLSGFAIDIIDERSRPVIPGITPACIDVDRHSIEITPVFKVDGQIRSVSRSNNSTTASVVIIEGDRINISSRKTVEEFLDQIRPRGNVIGPEVILKSDASKLIERLEEKLISQCVSEGWLDASAAKPLKQHLTAAHTALQDNQTVGARQAIQAFMDTLKQMEGTEPDDSNQEPPLTQEALTLLGTNAAYLLRTELPKISVPVEVIDVDEIPVDIE